MTIGKMMTDKIAHQLGSLEELLWLYDQVSPFHFVMGAEYNCVVGEETWRSVFNAVQARHPLLRVSITENSDGRVGFDEGTAGTIPLRMGDLNAGWNVEMSRELQEPFDHGVAPLIRAVLLPGLTCTIVLLSVHHSIADAIAVTGIFRDILLILAGEVPAILPLARSQDEMLGVNPRGAHDGSASDRSLPRSSTDGTYRQRLEIAYRTLPETLLRRIAEKARSEQTTVFGALCAATILAGRALSDEWRQERFRFLCPVSSRSHSASPEAVRPYFNILALEFDPSDPEELWLLARHCKARVVPGQSKDVAKHISETVGGLLTARPDPHSVSRFMHGHFGSRGCLSNIGIFPYETAVGQARLNAIWGPALSTGVDGEQYVGAVTVDGRLHLTNTSSKPIGGLLEKMEYLLEEAS